MEKQILISLAEEPRFPAPGREGRYLGEVVTAAHTDYVFTDTKEQMEFDLAVALYRDVLGGGKEGSPEPYVPGPPANMIDPYPGLEYWSAVADRSESAGERAFAEWEVRRHQRVINEHIWARQEILRQNGLANMMDPSVNRIVLASFQLFSYNWITGWFNTTSGWGSGGRSRTRVGPLPPAGNSETKLVKLDGYIGSRGILRTGGYDPQKNTVFISGEIGHPQGMAAAGGRPSGATSGLSVLETPTSVRWATDSPSMPQPLTLEQSKAIQAALEKGFPNKVVTRVAEIRDL